MADVNKKGAVSKMTGLPSKGAILQAGPDNVQSAVTDGNGVVQGPAALKEGEFVFSVPAIVALGEGDYDTGIQQLEQLHQELAALGEQMLSGQGLGAVEESMV